ncbi:flagellar protein [Hoeflea alexandrii]|uniref:flagellar protein n=1 Tax=Hoeflea alexandrii TaxID=288436 RepID=UPI0022AFA4E9|nr:flagellar protein [Hoeflea alexandrii]MCZ4290507.1 flagellar protein [Hoeflea alexandrii]
MTDVAEAAIETNDSADETPVRATKRKRNGDRVLAVAGFMLATAAAFFPWYVFFNQEDFGIAPMGYTETRDLPETGGRSFVNVSPLAIPDEKDGSGQPSAFDPIITATVSGEGSESTGAPALTAIDPDKSFPGKPRYKLLHVANGRALIEDKSGMYIVRIGSVLPDNSRLATLEKRDGQWVIITSNGEVIQR